MKTRKDYIKEIKTLLWENQLNVSDYQVERLAHFAELVVKKNQDLNLISRKDEENIRSAETNMKKYLELASAENINESVRGKYKKEADYFRRYAKYWKLSGNEQILFARDSLKKSL